MNSWQTKNGYRILQVLAGRSNVFLLTNGERNILIDTSPESMRHKLEMRLKELKVNKIYYLILTHTHYDHAANASWIKEKYQAKIIVHKNEASCLLAGENILPKGTNPLSKTIVRLFGKIFLSIAKYQPSKYDFLVDSVFDLNDAGFNACIIHTPGHTSGSVSVTIDDEFAIVGDTMFGVFRWSVFPPYANDVKQMINSWGTLLKTKCSVFIPGHGSANNRLMVQKAYNKKKHF